MADIPPSHIVDIYNTLGGTNLTKFHLICDEQMWPCDGHPNDMGHKIMASQVYKAMFQHPLPIQSGELNANLNLASNYSCVAYFKRGSDGKFKRAYRCYTKS